MSTIVTMITTVGEYLSGNTYRVRTREASKMSEAGQATILDKQTEPTTTIEGE
jgi:hypothetical protein